MHTHACIQTNASITALLQKDNITVINYANAEDNRLANSHE